MFQDSFAELNARACAVIGRSLVASQPGACFSLPGWQEVVKLTKQDLGKATSARQPELFTLKSLQQAAGTPTLCPPLAKDEL